MEIYQTHLLVEDAAQWILRVTQGEPAPEAIICDHDKEDRATLERHLRKPTIAARKAVQTGIDLVAARIRPAGDGKPRLFICENALVHSPDERLAGETGSRPYHTLSEIDEYVWKKQADGGVVKDEPEKKHDHGCDAMRYLVMHLDHGPAPSTEANYILPEPDADFERTFGDIGEPSWV
ncbi:MAG: hypothetical protein U0798_15195 [Gemmataceae bacterium]